MEKVDGQHLETIKYSLPIKHDYKVWICGGMYSSS